MILFNSSNIGASILHGAHQEAKKFTANIFYRLFDNNSDFKSN